VRGISFTDEVTGEDVTAIADAARKRLALVDPPRVTIGSARLASEGIAFPVAPPGKPSPRGYSPGDNQGR
jgi:hypothetical protein